MSDKLIYYIQIVGSLLVVIGSAFRLFAFESIIVPVVFSSGSLLLIYVYYMQYHKQRDANKRMQRLYRLMFFISLLLGVASYLIFIKDERWIVLVLIYALTSVFLSFRGEANKDSENANS